MLPPVRASPSVMKGAHALHTLFILLSSAFFVCGAVYTFLLLRLFVYLRKNSKAVRETWDNVGPIAGIIWETQVILALIFGRSKSEISHPSVKFSVHMLRVVLVVGVLLFASLIVAGPILGVAKVNPS
jgi:hypothetical protein